MHCVIVGMGQVGFHVASSLDDEHEVIVVDCDQDRLDRRKQELDVMTVQGDGALVSTLREANTEDADMLVACTADDKTNIVACGMSKILGNPFTIARVHRTDYLESWREGRRPLGVNFMIGANFLTARTIARHIGLPQAREIDFFASGRIQLAEFDIPEDSPLVDQSIAELDGSDRFSDLSIMAVFSDGVFEFPRGDTMVRAEDRLLVAGSIDAVHQFSQRLLPVNEDATIEQITIFGATEIGVLVAEFLEKSDYSVRLIEEDPDRAQQVAEALPQTLVLNHVPTDADFLMEERVNESDVVVSTLEQDEDNLLMSVFAKKIGAKRAISVIRKNDYIHLFEDVGVDVPVNPRLLTAEEITRHTRGEGTENIAILEGENVEVLEMRVDKESTLVDMTIEESSNQLPRRTVFGPLMRNGDMIIPRGSTKLKQNDRVLILAHTDKVDDVQNAI